VELFIHKGGYCPYGLLGGEFVPEDTRLFRLQVVVSSDKGRRFDSSLAGSIDEVRFGLPREYSEAVQDGVTSARANLLLGSGLLRFDCAAHGKVGSSPNLFRLLAKVIVRLLCGNAESVTEESLVRLLEDQE
jgi:hypothetical protein